MRFEFDMSDCYRLYALGSARPIVSDGCDVLCCLPSMVSTDGRIAEQTTYISLVVVPAGFEERSVWDYFSYRFEDAGVFSRQQIGSMYRVKASGGVTNGDNA